MLKRTEARNVNLAQLLIVSLTKYIPCKKQFKDFN